MDSKPFNDSSLGRFYRRRPWQLDCKPVSPPRMLSALCLLAAALAAACGPHLKYGNPQTGEVVSCGPYEPSELEAYGSANLTFEFLSRSTRRFLECVNERRALGYAVDPEDERHYYEEIQRARERRNAQVRRAEEERRRVQAEAYRARVAEAEAQARADRTADLKGSFGGPLRATTKRGYVLTDMKLSVDQAATGIRGSWSTNDGRAGSLRGIRAYERITELLMLQEKPCEGRLSGTAAIEKGATRIRAAPSGSDCQGTLEFSFRTDKRRWGW